MAKQDLPWGRSTAPAPHVDKSRQSAPKVGMHQPEVHRVGGDAGGPQSPGVHESLKKGK